VKYLGFVEEEKAERWARERLGLDQEPEFFRAASAVDAQGDYVCVVVITNFTSRNVDLNIAMESKKMRPRATIEMFNGIFGFVFKDLGIARVTGLLRGKNAQSIRISEHFGFKREGVMRKAFEDDDLHIYGFLAEDYHAHKWYRPKENAPIG
jgi:RimJ/RimL family protein N-acetyltransferase